MSEPVESVPAQPVASYITRCISLYHADNQLLEQLVAQCRAAGATGMSASRLLRIALRRVQPALAQVIAEEIAKR